MHMGSKGWKVSSRICLCNAPLLSSYFDRKTQNSLEYIWMAFYNSRCARRRELWGDTSIGAMNTWVRREKLQRIRCTGDYYLKVSKCLQIIQWLEVYEETATETQQLMEHNPGLRRKSKMKATSAFPEHLINAGFCEYSARKREWWKQKELTRNINDPRVAGPQLKAFGDLQAETTTGKNPELQICWAASWKVHLSPLAPLVSDMIPTWKIW